MIVWAANFKRLAREQGDCRDAMKMLHKLSLALLTDVFCGFRMPSVRFDRYNEYLRQRVRSYKDQASCHLCQGKNMMVLLRSQPHQN
jgi:hypothetical protein